MRESQVRDSQVQLCCMAGAWEWQVSDEKAHTRTPGKPTEPHPAQWAQMSKSQQSRASCKLILVTMSATEVLSTGLLGASGTGLTCVTRSGARDPEAVQWVRNTAQHLAGKGSVGAFSLKGACWNRTQLSPCPWFSPSHCTCSRVEPKPEGQPQLLPSQPVLSPLSLIVITKASVP